MDDIIEKMAETIWHAEFCRAFDLVPAIGWEGQDERLQETFRSTARALEKAEEIRDENGSILKNHHDGGVVENPSS